MGFVAVGSLFCIVEDCGMNMYDRRLAARNARLAYFKKRSVDRLLADNLTSPEIEGVLAGNPLGLLPVSLLEAPLKLKVPVWIDFPPRDTIFDYVFLQWRPQGSSDGEYKDLQLEVDGIKVPGPAPAAGTLLEFFIPVESFTDSNGNVLNGAYEFRYSVKSFNGGLLSSSLPVQLVLDTIPPYGSTGYPEDLVLPVGPVIDTNVGAIKADIPAYDDQAEGDKIGVFWIKGDVPDDISGLTPIGGYQDVPTDKVFSIPEAIIKAGGDGDFFAVYILLDKAGNDSRIGKSHLMQVALGPLPTPPLAAPTVRHADDVSDDLIDREDAFAGVFVDINTEISNWKIGDVIVVQWKDATLDPYPLIGFPVSVPVPWITMKGQYDFTAGDSQDTAVKYSLVRGSLPFPSEEVTIKVDLSKVGPENPGEPNPENPALGLVTVTSFTNETDKIVLADRGESATAALAPYVGIDKDQLIELYWAGALVGSHTVDAEQPGDPDIEISVAWADIEKGGNGLVDVWFKVSHPDFINAEHSKSKQVDVTAVDVKLPDPVFPKIDTTLNWLNCPSLELTDDGSYGVRVHIPASAYLLEGKKINIKWTSYTDTSNTVPLTDGELESGELTVSKDQQDNGLDFWVRPYETYFLPIYGFDADNNGSGKVEYTLEVAGQLYTGTTTVEIAMWGAGVSCPIPPPIIS